MMKILFVCVHNSGRSQLAEELTRLHGDGKVQAESAGLEPGKLNPFVVQVLSERGVDIAGKKTRGIMDLYNEGRTYDYVITVCSREVEEKCPIFPGNANRVLWAFEDPAAFTGTEDEIREKVRSLAARIEVKVKAFLEALVF